MPFVKYQFARPSVDEIVDDSEPEREELRTKERKRKKTVGNMDTRDNQSPSPISKPSAKGKPRSPQRASRTIIEISDDDDEPCASKRIPLQTFSVRPATPPPPPEADEFEDYWNVVLTPPSQAYNSRVALTLAEDNFPPPTTQSAALESSECSESPAKERLKIGEIAARYAYVGPSRASSVITGSRACSSRAASLAVEDLPVVPIQVQIPKPSRGASTSSSHRFTAFSDSELSRLLKCVSCSLSWTSRKTVAQKMKHIQICAKKLKFTDETITILIRQELALSSSESTKVKAKAKEKAHITEPEVRTMLEGAVQNDGVKKRPGPRPKVIESVQELTETRQVILDRARLLLETKSAPKTGISGSLSRTSSPPPLTQPFGDSGLALRFSSKAAMEPTQRPIFVPSPSAVERDHDSFSHSSHYDVLHSPPSTQPFGESALAGHYGIKSTYIDDTSPPVYITSPLAQRNRGSDVFDQFSPTPCVMELPEMLPLSPPDRLTNPTTEFNASSCLAMYRRMSSANEVGPSRSTPSRNHRDPKQGSLNSLSSPVQHEKRSDTTRILDSPLIEPYGNDYPEWDLDDAIMHYEPDESLPEAIVSESRMVSPSVISHPVPIPIPDRRRGQTPPLVTPTDPIPSYSPKGSPSNKTRKKTTKATRIHTDIPDDELFKRLKTDILSDKHLYLRILRYEPIHFDVFLQLAAQSGVSSKGLKYRVRNFLDKQAIQFSDLDTKGGGRVKKRRR